MDDVQTCTSNVVRHMSDTSAKDYLKPYLIFSRYGYMIALHPKKFLIGCLIFAGFGSLGLLRFRQEKNPIKLWIPPNSDFKHDTDWIIEKFKEGYRIQYLLLTAPNVLEPSVIQEVIKTNLTS